MNHSPRRTALMVTAAGAAILLVACSSSSKTNTSTATTAAAGATGAPAAAISASSFNSDFSAMAQLKSVASKGKGLIGVLLPDTTTSARYETFDRPYLTKAFEAAGLSFRQFDVDTHH